MTNKKIIFVLALFLVLFVAVGAVSAADDIAVNDVNDGGGRGIAVLNSGVPNQVNGTFADLQSIIDDKDPRATIELEKNYVYTADSEDVYGIVIDKPLTIDGKGFILDGKSTSRIFYVNSSDVVIKNINFVNGFTTNPAGSGAYYQGAGILFYGKIDGCTVENCNFTNMVGDTYSAISFDQGADGNVTNCQFTDCKATKGAAGAIGFGYQAGTKSLVNDCTFDNCGSTASGTKGGAITFASLDYTAGEISNCDFKDCYSGTGGAVSFSAGGATVNECTFTECKATDTWGTGGAIYSKKSGITIDSCEFIDCTANNGAALFFDSSKENNISESVFVSDVSTGSLIASGTIDMENCIFEAVEGTKLVTSSGTAKNSFWNDKAPVKGTDYQNIKVSNYVTLDITGSEDKLNFAFKANDSSEVSMPDYAVTVEVISGEETISQPVIISENTGSCDLPERCDKVTVKNVEGNEIKEFAPDIVYINTTGSDANPGTEDAPVATLEKALRLVAKGGSIVFLGEDTYELNNVVVDKAVTITTNGKAILSGDNANPILTINADNVVIKDLTVVAKDNGTAIDMAGNTNNVVVLNNVTFNGKNITVVNLGSASTLTVTNCIANDGAVKSVEGATITGEKLVIAVKSIGDKYTITADATAGGLYIKGLNFNFTSNGTVIGAANDTLNGTYYLNNVEFEPGTYIISADLDAEIINATVTKPVPTPPPSHNYKLTGGNVEKFVNGTECYTVTLTDNGKAVSNEIITISLNNETFKATTDKNGKATFKLDLPAGTYTVTAKWNNLTVKNTITVKELPHNYKLSADNVTKFVNGTECYTVTLTDNGKAVSNETIVISLNGETFNATTDKNGKATFKLDLPAGNYTVTAKWNNLTINNTITVNLPHDYKLSANNVTKFVNGTECYNVTLTDNGKAVSNETIVISLNGETFNATTDKNGKATFKLDLPVGNYTVTAKWNNLTVKNTITVKALPQEYQLTAGDITKYFKGPQRYTVTLTKDNKPLSNETITITINGKSYTRVTDENGTASLAINLNVGEYNITASWKNMTVKNTVTVLTTIHCDDFTKYYLNGTQYEAYVLDSVGNPLDGVTITFNINGVFYTRTAHNGTVKLNINLLPGEYIITAYNDVTGEASSATVTVLPTLTGSDLNMTYKDGSVYECKLVDGQGNPVKGVEVTLNIHGVFYHKITDDDGIARLNINLLPGEYIITAIYGSTMTSNIITVRDL